MTYARREDSVVYFMRRVDGEGPIKIGCSQLVAKRLEVLHACSPYPLRIIATIPGRVDLERRFHAAFLHQHSHAEWFTPTAHLERVVAEVQAGTFDVESLPPGQRLRPLKKVDRKWSPSQRARFRVNGLRSRSGLIPPDDVTEAAEALDGLTGDERAAADALIEGYLRAPWDRGTVPPYPWAIEAFNAYAPKHGLAPIETLKPRKKAA